MNQIIEFLPDATFAIDREGGKVIAWNRAIEEMTGGVKKEAMLGRGGLRVRRTLLRRTAAAACRPGSPRRSRDRVPVGQEERRRPCRGDSYPSSQGGRAGGAHIKFAATALLDRSGEVTGGAIESIRDVSDEVMTEAALQNASRQLNTLTGGILRTDLANRLAVLYGHLSVGVMKFDDPAVLSFIDDLNNAANGIRRRIEISREFRNIGMSPPAWIPPVQQTVRKAAATLSFGSVSRCVDGTARDLRRPPHLATVFTHLFENSLAPATKASRIVVTYHLRPEGCAIVVEDDGTGIPDAEKGDLFGQKAESYGHGLFLAHEILAITGIAIRETGTFGTGGRGSRSWCRPKDTGWYEAIGMITAVISGNGMATTGIRPEVRELTSAEFPAANEVWRDYHGTTGEPARDRIFATFLAGRSSLSPGAGGIPTAWRSTASSRPMPAGNRGGMPAW